MSCRAASHAGSWYTDDGKVLDRSLTQWLSAVDPTGIASAAEVVYPSSLSSAVVQASCLTLPIRSCRAVVAPHAGYSYSGPAAAWAYKCIDASDIDTVFILGPSHHVFLRDCALSACSEYATPIGSLPIDADLNAELAATGKFSRMDIRTDEDEHSIEMHLPYVRKVFQGKNIKIVPILVGRLSDASQALYGQLLAPYLANPKNFFVVSSDFCHWGTRFDYTHYRPSPTAHAARLKSSSAKIPEREGEAQIWESIRDLDAEGMAAMSYPHSVFSEGRANTAGKSTAQAAEAFRAYMDETKNTICGCKPIGVLLQALTALERDQGQMSELRFVRYEQSSKCYNVRDSSVSYASAFARFL
ncbi:UPF0103-domain-containing protein [Tilletiaria anomala UBC 951]|uniref:UPF0103-domain-containing protein n=1 Tax=Tilletiaria anomala (strain ATCC 24038 / CBS 436.72 / UBC 951) TaxID=1037660 RepID=A0A066VLJ5_TILAU|nr:UPF0103-domain-containing protein [Tilletiaria anomala UBC 951]KDN41163.1 UPF0103-domain-containing protein [Tilletiaria anomala UBC 951]